MSAHTEAVHFATKHLHAYIDGPAYQTPPTFHADLKALADHHGPEVIFVPLIAWMDTAAHAAGITKDAIPITVDTNGTIRADVPGDVMASRRLMQARIADDRGAFDMATDWCNEQAETDPTFWSRVMVRVLHASGELIKESRR